VESRWVALDVGETLIDETRVWSVWADVLGVPRLTLMAALGAEVATAGDHRNAFDIVGAPNWRDLFPRVEEVYGGFKAHDLYPDALPAVQALCASGYRVAILAKGRLVSTGRLTEMLEFQARGWELVMANVRDGAVASLGSRVGRAVSPDSIK